MKEVTGGFRSQWPVTGALIFFLYEPQQTVEQTMETPVIWDTIVLIMKSL